jgi:hypothetical protein
MSGRLLRPFQEIGVNKGVAKNGRMGFFVDMGLGKTPMSSKVAGLLGWRRIVVVCKDSGIRVWKTIGKAWLEEFTGLPIVLHVMDGEAWTREFDWALVTPDTEVHVWIVVYNTFAIDMGQRSKTVRRKAKKRGEVVHELVKKIKSTQGWDGVICDECRRMANRDSAAWLAVYYFTREHARKGRSMGFIPLSGTPSDKGPQGFWGYLRIIDPVVFRSYWAFIEHFHIVDDTNPILGKVICDQRLDTKAEWDRLMSKYFYVVKEEDVASERPPIDRQIRIAELTPSQKKLYDEIAEENISIGNDGSVVVAQNAFVQMLRLRQILVCPKILGPEFDCGGAIQDFADELEEASPEARHTVIFTPFKGAFPYFTEYLKSRGFPDIFWLHSGISDRDQGARIEAWRRTRGVMLNTIDYAEAYSLEPATHAWFIGSSWSPDPNKQAEKRLLRLTSANPILIWYYTYKTPIDWAVTQRVCIKQENIDLSIPSQLSALATQGQLDQNLILV